MQADAQPAPTDSPDYFEQAMTARRLADFARRTRDANAMLVAARMLLDVPVSTMPAGPASAAEDEAPAFSPRALLAEARTLAGSDTALLTQIRVMDSQASRGVLSSALGKGLVRSVQALGPRAAYQFSISARGGEPLRIGAIGDIGTTLALRLTDARGKVVCTDDQNDYAPVCQLKPSTAASYRVDVINKSSARSRTVILSN